MRRFLSASGGLLAVVSAAVLLATLGVVYLTTVHVNTALDRLAREGSIPRPVHGIPYADLINRVAARRHLNPALVAAVVAAESGFDPHARSPRGAYGLMQVLPTTWDEVGRAPSCSPEIARRTTPACMDDPAANLAVGAAYFRRLVDRFHGDVVLAVAAYNAGAGAVLHHGGVPPFPETTHYLRQVALAWFHLQHEGTLTPFWLGVIRSFDLWQRARPVLVLLAVVVLVSWIGAGPRRPSAEAFR
jgi:hypothetical protein